MAIRRLFTVGSIALTGLLLLVPNLLALAGGLPPAGIAIAVVGSVLSTVLLVASGLLYRSDTSTRHVTRVAGWNLLGFVVLGGVLVAASAVVGPDVPLYVASDILAVSAFAHLVIGVNDIQRIRARELAREQEKLAVVNRLLRHNLRHEAQILLGYGDAIEDDVARRKVNDVAERLGEMNDRARELQELLGAVVESDESVRLASVVAAATARLREAHPDATIEVSVPDDLVVSGDERLERVVFELAENALVHGDGERVTITAESTGARVELGILDEGEGLPRMERAVLNRETPISQVSHSKGVGLWLSKWTAESFGGEVGFSDEGEESAVVVRLDRATL